MFQNDEICTQIYTSSILWNVVFLKSVFELYLIHDAHVKKRNQSQNQMNNNNNENDNNQKAQNNKNEKTDMRKRN